MTCQRCGGLLVKNQSVGEVRLCSSCAAWRKTAKQLRVGYWSALLPPKATPRP